MPKNNKKWLLQQLLYEVAKTPCSTPQEAKKTSFMMNVIHHLSEGMKVDSKP